jgi:hypothetical protein
MCCRGPPAHVKFLENVMLGSAQALKCQIKEGRMSYGKCQDPCSTKFSSVDDLKRR